MKKKTSQKTKPGKRGKSTSTVLDKSAVAEAAATEEFPTIELNEGADPDEPQSDEAGGVPETDTENANSGPIPAEIPEQAPVAAPEPETSPAATPDVEPGLSDEGSKAIVAIFGNARVTKLEPLTEAEARDRELLEEVVHRGIDSFIDTGKAMREIHDRKLFKSTHKNFREYVRATFQLGKSQGYKIMGAAHAAEMITGATVDGEAVAVATPSIKAASEFDSISGLVDTTNLSMAEVVAFTEDLQQFALELAIEVAPKIDGKAQLSQKVFQAVKDVLLEAATLKVVDVEGEHHEVSAAHVAITREVFEGLMREKQKWVDEIRARNERLNTPQTVTRTAAGVDQATAPKVEMTCSVHGKTDLREFKIIFAGFVLSCGCKFRRVEGEDALTYVENEKAASG